MHKIYLILLFLVGLINFVPVFAIVSADKVRAAYGISNIDSNLAILLRHRALLFGIVGGFILYSVFHPQYQSAAMIMAAVSMVGFLGIFWAEGDSNPELWKIAKIDIMGIALLITAFILNYFATSR